MMTTDDEKEKKRNETEKNLPDMAMAPPKSIKRVVMLWKG